MMDKIAPFSKALLTSGPKILGRHLHREIPRQSFVELQMVTPLPVFHHFLIEYADRATTVKRRGHW